MEGSPRTWRFCQRPVEGEGEAPRRLEEECAERRLGSRGWKGVSQGESKHTETTGIWSLHGVHFGSGPGSNS